MPVERKSFTGTEIRAGLMVLLSAAVLVVFIAAILKYRPRGESKTFYIHMTDIGGLDRGADVRFGGMVVGRVTRIAQDPGNHTHMIVTAKVRIDAPINAASLAFPAQTTLTSEKHLEITTGAPDAPLLDDGATIESAAGGGMFGDLNKLTASLDRLLADVTVLLGATDAEGNALFRSGESRTVADLFNTLDDTMQDMRVLMGVVDDKGDIIPPADRQTLADLLGRLDGALADGQSLISDVRGILDENRQTISDVLEQAKEVGESADELVIHLDELLADNRETLDATLAGARDAVDKLNVVMIDVQDLVRTLQEVLDRNSPAFDDTIATLNDTLRNLEELTRTLADQPQAIIRGREPVGRQ